MFGMGMQELMVVGIIAVLLFGRKLPEVAKSLGSSYREFKKGLGDLTSEMNDVYHTATSSSSSPSHTPKRTYNEYDDYEEASAPKFDPPPAEPQEEDGQRAETASG